MSETSPPALAANYVQEANHPESTSKHSSDISHAGQGYPFEAADLKTFLFFSITCALIYPFLFAITKAADERSLFVVRLIVAIGCSAVALSIVYFLHKFIRSSVEAVTWGSIIEASQNDVNNLEMQDNRDITLTQFSKISYNPLSPLTVWRLLKLRHRISKGNSAQQAQARRAILPLSVAFVFFAIIVAGALTFALGRAIDITTSWTFETRLYDEVPVFGDLFDDADPQGTFIDTSTRLHQPYLEEFLRDPNPPAWEYDTPSFTQMQFGNETVYFTTPYAGQLRVNGTAYGAAIGASSTLFRNVTNNVGGQAEDDPSTASALWFPQWGTQVSCMKLPNIVSNIMPSTESAQVVLPRDFVSDLFGTLGLQPPEQRIQTLQPDYSPTGSLDRFFIPTAVPGNGSNPNVLSTITFRWDSKFNLSFPGPGTEQGRFVAGYVTDGGPSGNGFTIFDVFLMRCYTSFNADNPNQPTACRNLPLLSPYLPGSPLVGYDAVACVQRTESYIINVRNASQSVTIMNVVAKGQNLDDTVSARGRRRTALLNETYGRILSSKTKGGQYYEMNVFSTWSWLSRSGNMGLLSELDKSWFDEGSGISASKFEKFRGVAAATSVLPLMAGPKQLVSRQFTNKQIAHARILNVPMTIVIVVPFLAGLFGTFCVPKLPDKHNRRRLDLISFLIEVKGGHLSLKGGEQEVQPNMANMELKEAKDSFGKDKVVHGNCA